MRKLIAKITGWPLVSLQFGFSRYFRFAHKNEDGSFYVKIYTRTEEVRFNSSYHDFKPIMNCRKHGVPLFKD